MLTIADDISWMEEALCPEVGIQFFFPAAGQDALAQTAKGVCALCPVIEACREHALSRPWITGVWGGMSEHERDEERSRRHRARKRVAA